MSYKVQTQVYTGPFDLLLKLVTKQKVDIGALSISAVADQYLAEVERMEQMDLDVASDFVLIASTLLDIKAQSLLPLNPKLKEDEDQLDDPLDGMSVEEARQVLIARLVEYKKFRNASAALGVRGESEAKMFARSAGPDPQFLNLMPDYLKGVEIQDLARLCADLSCQREVQLLQSEHIAKKKIPLAFTIASVDEQTRSHPHTCFTRLLHGVNTPEKVVVTFLAILELSKLRKIDLFQSENFQEIQIQRVEGAAPFDIEKDGYLSVDDE